ncbi:PilW family protein [Noviherbaspirillum pedocola]|uniref:PilW family protein n=1 Tax=Noviherbaspirillum pedocola TaxID=2801341 RepID=A0A934T056_9BURK|nr:PilW family protein [Noviherbaspirillum pedocola]MBK4736004.1 PilW family protein [Noviherbaspirillum pedocola]
MSAAQNRARQAGVTLIELMVAMAISLLIVLIAASAVVASKQGFMTVDAGAQLRDNTRFAVDLVQQVSVQAGYLDVAFATAAASPNAPASTIDAPITGFNNALVPANGSDPISGLASNSRTAAAGGCSDAADTACANGSDVLVLRYQSAEGLAGSGQSDQTMINCAGVPQTAAPATAQTRIVSIFHVARTEGGEPSLMCTTQDASGNWTTEPVVRGVEGFQVLYGVDAVTANAAPTGTPDSVTDTYLRADQIVVPGDAAATNANWRRVRSLRIGLLVRGPRNSVQDRAGAMQPYYVLGQAASSTGDTGAIFTPSDDGRLRQVATTTIHLRNPQGG